MYVRLLTWKSLAGRLFVQKFPALVAPSMSSAFWLSFPEGLFYEKNSHDDRGVSTFQVIIFAVFGVGSVCLR